MKGKISNICVRTQAGKNEVGQNKINQDNYVMIERIFELDNYNIFGILDGHGKYNHNIGINGHIVSTNISKFFTNYFKNQDIYKLTTLDEESIYDKLRANNYEIIKKSFKDAEVNLVVQRIDCNFSGSTAVLVIMIGNKIICANAGDSRAIFVKESSSNI
jgi:serine/threonine protein phosphatase PrpC